MLFRSGTGFDTDEVSDGFGLDNMAERVEGITGSLFIDSVPGRGTVIHVAFPLQAAKQE